MVSNKNNDKELLLLSSGLSGLSMSFLWFPIITLGVISQNNETVKGKRSITKQEMVAC